MTVTHLDHMISLWLAKAQTYHVIKVRFFAIVSGEGRRVACGGCRSLVAGERCNRRTGPGVSVSVLVYRRLDVRATDFRTAEVRAA